MSRTIWKSPLAITDLQTLRLPVPEPLSVGLQNGELVMWSLVSPGASLTEVQVRICGTGNPGAPASSAWKFLGSIQDGQFVWHVFTRIVTP